MNMFFSNDMQFDDVDFCDSKLRRHSSSFVKLKQLSLIFISKLYLEFSSISP
jgi:hypothetical protein